MSALKRYAVAGAVLGGLIAGIAYAPAAWLAGALASATDERLLLADARGTLWSGSALLVLTGGPGSHDASALPGRLQWRVGLDGATPTLRLTQACCLTGEVMLHVKPGLGRLLIELPTASEAASIGSWPASWLVGLGTPWNTLQPSGRLLLSSRGLVLEQVQGRWRFSGQAVLELAQIASRVSTLDTLGSYRLVLSGDAGAAGPTRVQLLTTGGALQLSGSGEWAASKLRFNGQAGAAPGSEAALGNLLNIIGRRQGALSLISIG